MIQIIKISAMNVLRTDWLIQTAGSGRSGADRQDVLRLVLGQCVHCTDYCYFIVSPAMMDPPDVSGGINERVSTSGVQRSRNHGNLASLSA